MDTIKQTKKWEDLLTFSAIVWLVLLVNIHASDYFFRIDLTEEKRYTMSEATQQTLENLDETIYIEVFLEGELNASFRRLQEVIRETLEEFRLYAGDRLQYQFIDPNDAPNPQALRRIQQELVERGLPSTYLNETVNGNRIQKLIFPGAIISYGNKEKPVLLLKGNKGASPEQQINQSAEGVEYELASVIRQLSNRDKKRIAFIEGHDELREIDVVDIMSTLEESYYVDRIAIGQVPLEEYDALILAQPKKRMSEQEVFLLDQYVVGGGSALLLIDKIQMNIDSIATGGTYAFGYDLGLEDLLFRFGVRVNTDLIQDQQAGLIEVETGNFGARAQTQKLPWPYYVYLNKFSKHPIVRNMDVVYAKFLSTIDTVAATGITKTPLFFTSQYTRVKPAPTMVDLNELKGEMRNQALFNKANLPVAYLLEGTFHSLYANQGLPLGISPRPIIPKGSSKVIVVSDADIIRNEIDPKTQKPEPIDFDKYRGQPTSNKDFVLNALSYLTDETGLINARKKQVTLRPLDGIRIKEERSYWQLLNIALPVSAVLLFGVGYTYWRRKKYRK